MKMLLLPSVMALLLSLSTVSGLDCYFDANTTQITEMPRMVSCGCDADDNVFDMARDIVNKVSEQIEMSMFTHTARVRARKVEYVYPGARRTGAIKLEFMANEVTSPPENDYVLTVSKNKRDRPMKLGECQ